MWRCWCWLHASCCCGGGGPRLLHRRALQCGCMAQRPPSRASATPNAIGTAGRNSRECPLEPAAPAGRSWAVRVGCFTTRVLWWHLAVALVMVPTLRLDMWRGVKRGRGGP
ncbi:retrotransposon hot spot (RHS) protein [Trypanosoma cruzi]|nr:retrotransposon hot spot (RHS) protein [Trypanosoma cruzi]